MASRLSPFRFLRSLLLTQSLVVAGPVDVLGQVAYSAANGNTSISPPRFGFLSFDVAQAQLGVTFTGVRSVACSSPGCPTIQLTAHVSASAREGEDNVFSRIDFNPGYGFGGRVLYQFGGVGLGYSSISFGLRYNLAERKVVEFAVDSSAVLSDPNQHTFAAALAFNHAFDDTFILGVAAEGRRETSSPGYSRRQRVCTTGFLEGTNILISSCRDRFPGPLSDVWSAQIRADLAVTIADLGGIIGTKLGLVSAASVDLLQDANPAANVAVGPALFPTGYPGQIFLTVMFELRDAFDANSLADRFFIRLMAGLPFGVLLRE